jgi:hypothetical protein
MGGLRAGQDLGANRFGIVSAEDPSFGVFEGEIDQRLVAGHLGDLGLGPVGPQQLAHDPHRARVAVEQLREERQDPRRVAPDGGYVLQLCLLGEGTQAATKWLEGELGQQRNGGLSSRDTVLDKGTDPRQRLFGTAVEQSLMCQTAGCRMG